MAWMNRVFGKKTEKAAAPNVQIQKLGDTLDVVEKREAVLNKKIEMELNKAREASKKNNKSQAMIHLKRKKTYEDQLQKLNAQRSNIEQMQMKLEEAAMNKETLEAQVLGAQAIKATYGKMTPEKIDKTMDEVREVMDNANEVSEAISQPLGGDNIDEDELEAELASLEQEALDSELLGINSNTTPLPVVPNSAIGTKKPAAPQKVDNEEEEALRQLEAELNT